MLGEEGKYLVMVCTRRCDALVLRTRDIQDILGSSSKPSSSFRGKNSKTPALKQELDVDMKVHRMLVEKRKEGGREMKGRWRGKKKNIKHNARPRDPAIP